MSNKEKILSPKIDIVFQILFGEVGSEKITKDFLSAVLNEKITKINLNENPILRRANIDDKMGILDVVAEINGEEYCNIEMQVAKQNDLIERLLYYWSKIYSREIKKGEDFRELKRTVSILIVDFEVKSLEGLEYCSKWRIIENKGRKITLTDKMEIVIIELPKIYNNKIKENKLLEWLYFIDDPESVEVKRIMRENEGIKEANKKLEEISNDGQLQQLAKWREDGIRLAKAREREDRERAIKDKERERMDRERAIKDKEIERKDKEIERKDKEIAKREKKLEEKEKEIVKKERRIEQIEVKVEKQRINMIKAMEEQGLDIDMIEKITGENKEKIKEYLKK